MESIAATKFKGYDVYVILKGGDFYLSFGSDQVHHYWLEAFRDILKKDKNYNFTVETPDGEIEVTYLDLERLMNEINMFIKVLCK